MRRRRGPLAKVKLKMPVAVRSPPAEAERGPGGGVFRRCVSASPVPSLPALSAGPGPGRCSVLPTGAGGAAGCPSSGPCGAGSSPARPGRGAELQFRPQARSPPGNKLQNASGRVLPRVQQKFSKRSLIKQTLRPAPGSLSPSPCDD